MESLTAQLTYPEHKINLEKNFISGWYIDKSFCRELKQSIINKKILLEADKSNFRNYLSADLDAIDKSLFDKYIKIISNLKDLYCKEYPFLKTIENLKLEYYIHTDKSKINIIKIQKYQPNKYYNSLHCENLGEYNTRRVIVFMTYLNTIKNGGGTNFPYQNFSCSADEGLTLLWPAGWTHPHIGIVSPDETKYILTGCFIWE